MVAKRQVVEKAPAAPATKVPKVSNNAADNATNPAAKAASDAFSKACASAQGVRTGGVVAPVAAAKPAETRSPNTAVAALHGAPKASGSPAAQAIVAAAVQAMTTGATAPPPPTSAAALTPPSTCIALPGSTNSADITALLTTDKGCRVCGGEVDENMGTARCRKCNGLQSRISRIMTKRPFLMNAWGDMSLDARERFYQENHAKYGQDLEALVEHAVTEVLKTRVTVTFGGSGLFLDEADLDDKYRDKPAQLAAIKRNGRRVYCSVRETTLFEVLEYNSSAVCEEELIKEEERKWEQARQLKGEKAPKKPKTVKREIAAGEAGAVVPKPVAAGTLKRIARLVENVKAKSELIAQSKAEIEATPRLNDFVPKYAVSRATIAVASAVEQIASAEIVLEEKASANSKELLSSLSDAKEKVESASTSLSYQIDEAKAAVAAEGGA